MVDESTELQRAVVLPHVEIGRSCYVANAIIDENCVIPHGMVIGRDPAADAERFHITDNGIVLVTRDMLIALRRRFGN
jgi:glucose-1-phosphate adenylyltransferase